LGGIKGLLAVTSAALENVSTSLIKLKELTVKLADSNITGAQRTQYQVQAGEISTNIKSFIEDASYNDKNIIQEDGDDAVTIINSTASTYTITAYDAIAGVWDEISKASGYTSTSAAAALATDGALNKAISNTLTQLNVYGSAANYIDNQINFNKSKIDGLEAGMGALVDADLAKESARLQSLQIRQQLGTQALGIANQAPQSLLSLFR
jgi:flagellin